MLRLPEQSLRTKLATSGAKHLLSPNPHSHKRSDKTKPAISRLSASPTPGNAPLLLKRPAWRPRNLHPKVNFVIATSFGQATVFRTPVIGGP